MIPDSRGCGRRLYRKVQPLIEAATTTGNADRYRKRFLAISHMWLLILHTAGAGGGPGGRGSSLRQSHARLGASPSIRRRLKLPEWISLSQLARSSTSRQVDCFENLLQALTDVVKGTSGLGLSRSCKDADWRLLNKTKAIDSTFLRLSAKLSPWSKQGGYQAGVRVQWSIEIATKIPQLLLMHNVEQNDHDALWALVEHELAQFVGWTLIIDLGYYGHRQFERLLDRGVHFLSKLNAQAVYKETEHRPVTQRKGWTAQDDEVLSDHTITLGSANNRRGAVLRGIRLVTSRNPQGEVCRFITDRFDLEAWEVVALYRLRWRIELFFRWLKRQLGAIRPLGTSRQAVWLTMLVAGIVALLWLLLHSMHAQPLAMSRISWLGAVAVALQTIVNLSG